MPEGESEALQSGGAVSHGRDILPRVRVTDGNMRHHARHGMRHFIHLEIGLCNTPDWRDPKGGCAAPESVVYDGHDEKEYDHGKEWYNLSGKEHHHANDYFGGNAKKYDIIL